MAICRGRAEGQRGPVRSPGAHSFTCQQVGVGGECIWRLCIWGYDDCPAPQPSAQAIWDETGFVMGWAWCFVFTCFILIAALWGGCHPQLANKAQRRSKKGCPETPGLLQSLGPTWVGPSPKSSPPPSPLTLHPSSLFSVFPILSWVGQVGRQCSLEEGGARQVGPLLHLVCLLQRVRKCLGESVWMCVTRGLGVCEHECVYVRMSACACECVCVWGYVCGLGVWVCVSMCVCENVCMCMCRFVCVCVCVCGLLGGREGTEVGTDIPRGWARAGEASPPSLPCLCLSSPFPPPALFHTPPPAPGFYQPGTNEKSKDRAGPWQGVRGAKQVRALVSASPGSWTPRIIASTSAV